jgi:tetratricopeptide (TPR) repeat protein
MAGGTSVVRTSVRRGCVASDGIAPALLWIGTLALYAQVAHHGFLPYDDGQYVLANPVVREGLSWRGITWAFTTLHFSNWHPVTWLSHMLDVQLFGLDAGAHHLVSAGLHATNAALLDILLMRMTGARGRSALVAALFAVHPLHVESVAWIAERKDLLSTLFGLIAIAAYARYAARPGPARYAAVVLSFVASLMAKPMLVTLPFLLLLLDGWPLGRAPGFRTVTDSRFAPADWKRLIVEKAPLLVLSIASSAITVIAQSRGGSVADLGEVGLGSRIANAAFSYAAYGWKTLWPARLAIFYPYRHALPSWELGGAVLLLVGVTAAVVASARRAPWAAVGWLWFVGTLVPVIGVVQVGGQSMADRYTYVPAIGLFVAFVWGGHALASRWPGAIRPASVTAALAIAVLAVLTWRQIGWWSDHETLFRHAIAVTSPNARAHSVLSGGLRGEGRAAEALVEAEEAVRLEPGIAAYWSEVGLVLRDLRRLEPAAVAFERALALDPGLASAWAGTGFVAAGLGKLGEAEHAFRRATALAPDDALAWNELGLVLVATGRVGEAVEAYRHALEANPGAAAAWSNLAAAYQRIGRMGEAGEAFAAAVRADPATPAWWRNLGAFLASTGRSGEAVPVLEEALRRDPGSTDVLRRLGLAQAAAGQHEAALATAGRLELVDPFGAAQIRARVGATP